MASLEAAQAAKRPIRDSGDAGTVLGRLSGLYGGHAGRGSSTCSSRRKIHHRMGENQPPASPAH